MTPISMPSNPSRSALSISLSVCTMFSSVVLFWVSSMPRMQGADVVAFSGEHTSTRTAAVHVVELELRLDDISDHFVIDTLAILCHSRPRCYLQWEKILYHLQDELRHWVLGVLWICQIHAHGKHGLQLSTSVRQKGLVSAIVQKTVRGVSWSEVATVPKRKSHRGLDLNFSLNTEVNIWKGWKESGGTK